MTRRP